MEADIFQALVNSYRAELQRDFRSEEVEDEEEARRGAQFQEGEEKKVEEQNSPIEETKGGKAVDSQEENIEQNSFIEKNATAKNPQTAHERTRKRFPDWLVRSRQIDSSSADGSKKEVERMSQPKEK